MTSKVYFIPASKKEPPEVLARKAEKLFLMLNINNKIESSSFVGLKIHFGEKGNEGHINPLWLLDIINNIKKRTSRVFLTDTNTLYRGERSDSIHHIRIAWKHGFSLEKLGIPVVIADGLVGRDDEEVCVNLSRIKSARIASAFLNINFLLCLSHFTGHDLTGFGAAIKNLGMGCASRAGKLEQHSDVHPWVSQRLCKNCGVCLNYCPSGAIVQKGGKAYIIDEKCIGCGECLVVCSPGAIKIRWDKDSMRIQEKIAEYAFGVKKIYEEKIGFINFLLEVTKYCDCWSKQSEKIVEDIGILASIDPVAVDKASVDLINQRSGKDILKEANGVDWTVQLKRGEDIGLGSMKYKFIHV